MVGCIIIIVACALMGIWNFTIAILGLFPKFRATTVGTLKKSYTERNVQMRYGTIPVRTHYTYTYTVNGRKYNHRGSVENNKRSVLQKVHLVYVKWFPWRAYPNRFSGSLEWVLGIFGVVVGAMFTAVIFLA